MKIREQRTELAPPRASWRDNSRAPRRVQDFPDAIRKRLPLVGISLSRYRRVLKRLSVFALQFQQNQGSPCPPPLVYGTLSATRFSLPPCSMSHGIVTYLVPALRISTPAAIPGIRKLLARNSIGVHSNPRIPRATLSGRPRLHSHACMHADALYCRACCADKLKD